MKKFLRGIRWLDNNLLKIFFSFFIIFIPLYPKLPLIDIEYTYIYIRFEDFLVALIYLIFLIQLIRKKIVLSKKMFFLFLLFWLAVFISYLYGFFILKTVPVHYVGFLHSVRRVEYMGIFLVASSLIRKKDDLFYYLKIFLITFFLVIVYGIGQKLFGWPAVQTMNPEYARGYLLYLTPEARISSTFAGHYDFASYLIFLMPLVLIFYLWKQNFIYLGLFILGLINLVFTASRISYIGYVLTIFPMLLLIRRFKLMSLILILTIIFTLANQNLTSRLKRTFQVKKILVDQRTGEVYIPQKITTKELPAGSFYIPLKNQKISEKDLEAYKKSVILSKQTEATKSGQKVDIASLSANLKPIETVVSDISFATRLQVEWPRAIVAFKKSPFFGTGPSSLTEATDNDYLRWIGEFGLFGTSIFFIILFKLLKNFFFFIKKDLFFKKINEKIIFFGLIFGFLALMVNATYIDVFEASKVAFTFWSLVGIFYGYLIVKGYEK